MYELKRKARITEQIKMGDETLAISITPEEIAMEYQKAWAVVGQAQLSLKKAKENGDPEGESMEQLGNAVVQFMSVMLGAENTEKIVAFYENNYIEMINAVIPFIVGTLVPQIETAVTEMRLRKREAFRQAHKRKGVFRK